MLRKMRISARRAGLPLLPPGNFGMCRNCRNEDNTLFGGRSRDRYTVPPSGAVKTGRCIFGNCSSCVSFEAEHGYTPLVMELPDFRAPGIKSVVSAAAHRSGEYLKKAGTLIFLSSAVLYFLISFGAGKAAASPAESFGAFAGKLLAPLLKPCGLGFWQIALALICAVGAKEMAVSSLAVLYGAASAPALRAILSANGFTAASAVSFLVFAVPVYPLYFHARCDTRAIRRKIRPARSIFQPRGGVRFRYGIILGGGRIGLG